MPDRDSTLIVVVCEAAADQRTARTLADRILCSRLSWVEPTMLAAVRQWTGVRADSDFMSWSSVPREAKERGIRAHGHFEGIPGALDAQAGRRALLVVRTLKPCPQAVLLIRDSDGKPERRIGLEQARDSGQWSFAVVIGVAHVKLECWLLAACDVSSQGTGGCLRELSRELGFDPCEASHRLTAQEASAKRSAKRVLGVLCGGDLPSAESWIETADLELLKRRGAKNGLQAYLGEVADRLVPVFK